jgi:NAD(P)-dependent dehydrogenase (short-subunit alcohol dehydrogenase family)
MADKRIAVITGASGGLGAVIAREFIENGWRVVGMGRSPHPNNVTGMDYHQFDAGDALSCQQFWNTLAEDYGPSTDLELCLVNNAGGYVTGSLTGTTPEQYEQQMRSCYFSSVYMTQGLASVFPQARIINIISTSATTPHKNNSAYGAAKAAQMHFFQSLQHEFKPQQYRITNLYPYNIASHGPTDHAVLPEDLAAFVREQAENRSTYYLRDASVWPAE